MQIKTAPAATELQHSCNLDVTASTPPYFCHSGIMCTIGPSSKDVRVLERMMEAGMTITRLNFSHGTHKEQAEIIANIRQAETNYSNTLGYKYPVAIALDTKGPEIRTGRLEGGPKAKLSIKKGDQFKLSSDRAYAEKGNNATVFVDYDLSKVIKPGMMIFLDDGLISLEVTSTGPANVITTVKIGGELGSNKTVKLHGAQADLAEVSDKDEADLAFAVKNGLDMILASYINSAKTVNKIRIILGSQGRRIMVIAKIQTEESLKNIKHICDAADGIMVCRSDLVMDLLPIQVILAQKFMIAYCHKIKKPLICSSDILDTMAKMPKACLNEIADVSICLVDGADCVVLTSATSSGNYPVQSVISMKRIYSELSCMLWQRSTFEALKMKILEPMNLAETVALTAVEESVLCLAAAIIVITSSGRSAHLISKYKPCCPLIVVTRYPRVARQCNLYRGIISLEYLEEPKSIWEDDVDARLTFALEFAKQKGLVSLGDPVILVTGWKHGPNFANTIRAIYVCEE